MAIPMDTQEEIGVMVEAVDFLAEDVEWSVAEEANNGESRAM